MPPVRPVAGTFDILGPDHDLREMVVGRAIGEARLRGYTGVVTPIFEYTELFARGVGGGTDVVEKEMYTFEDRGGRSVTLRPEMTASVVRAYFDAGLNQGPQPARLHYWGPVFRYDRPQAGRYRQFFQHGVEAIGEGDPWVDVEVIELAHRGLVEAGVTGFRLQLNSIGDAVCRPAYRGLLRAHFRPHLDEMCEDCRRRFDTNPLRLLDCKKPACATFQEGAPAPVDHLCEACARHHRTVRAGLSQLGVEYADNPRLVRGLDYYTRTAFEFWHEDLAGAQNALGGGGRYDGLAETLGFQPTPAVGFSMGIDRIVLALQRAGVSAAHPGPLVAIIPAVAEAHAVAVRTAASLRAAGIPVTVDHGERSLRARMRQAQKTGVRVVVLFGADELAADVAAVRDMEAATQVSVPQASVVTTVTELIASPAVVPA